MNYSQKLILLDQNIVQAYNATATLMHLPYMPLMPLDVLSSFKAYGFLISNFETKFGSLMQSRHKANSL